MDEVWWLKYEILCDPKDALVSRALRLLPSISEECLEEVKYVCVFRIDLIIEGKPSSFTGLKETMDNGVDALGFKATTPFLR